jgi:hypothetical protein
MLYGVMKPQIRFSNIEQGQDRDIQGVDRPAGGHYLGDFFVYEIGDPTNLFRRHRASDGVLLAQKRNLDSVLQDTS